jgi:hypothetical protein
MRDRERVGVTVNALAPALIAETGMLPGDPKALRQQVPVGRLGRPEEVAALALAALRNPYLTDQVLSLDGASIQGSTRHPSRRRSPRPGTPVHSGACRMPPSMPNPKPACTPTAP